MCSGSEAGSYVRLIDFCMLESNKEEKVQPASRTPSPTRPAQPRAGAWSLALHIIIALALHIFLSLALHIFLSLALQGYLAHKKLPPP